MSNSLNRRNFLKLASSASLGMALNPFFKTLRPLQPAQSGKQNIIIVVFDAFSAYHLPIYGYARDTTPNITRLAKRAIVYHNHHAGGNFTTPGTASLLTGALPWSHRAFRLNGTVTKSFVQKNIFNALKGYYHTAYSHNPLANTLLKQFMGHIEDYVPQNRLFLTSDTVIEDLFSKDEDIASIGWERIIKKQEYGYTYSLFLSDIYARYAEHKIANIRQLFPRGIPSINGDNYFLLEDAINWLKNQVGQFSQPFFGYFHFLPPHKPYTTETEFFGQFKDDGFRPPAKPVDTLAEKPFTYNDLLTSRMKYDEFLLYVDREFGRLFDYLESSGILENTWVVLTSDHGELFERGISGHTTPVLYQPVIRVPLLIFEPGNKTRTDIHSLTSAVDLLPTLLHLTGNDSASWTEGTVLPPFSSENPDPNRIVYSLCARHNAVNTALTHATAAIIKGNYKLMDFFGYKELGNGNERVELYDIESDPQELNDLYATQKDTASELYTTLKEKLKEVNQPYLK